MFHDTKYTSRYVCRSTSHGDARGADLTSRPTTVPRDHCKPLAISRTGNNADLRVLDEAVKNKRVVLLGEFTHGRERQMRPFEFQIQKRPTATITSMITHQGTYQFGMATSESFERLWCAKSHRAWQK